MGFNVTLPLYASNESEAWCTTIGGETKAIEDTYCFLPSKSLKKL